MSIAQNFPAIKPSLLLDFANTSIIGTIYKPTGETDAEGNAVMAAEAGFHVNVLADAPELEQYQVFPAVPMRVWG